MDPNDQPPPARGTFLGVLLAIAGGAFFFTVLVIVMSPFLMQTLGALFIVILICGVGCVHYWVWGRSFSQQVAEQEQTPLDGETDTEPAASDDPHFGRRF